MAVCVWSVWSGRCERDGRAVLCVCVVEVCPRERGEQRSSSGDRGIEDEGVLGGTINGPSVKLSGREGSM